MFARVLNTYSSGPLWGDLLVNYSHLTFNTRKRCEICLKLTIKHQKEVVLMFLLLTLNIIQTFFSCFYCWLWTSRYVNWLVALLDLDSLLTKHNTSCRCYCLYFPRRKSSGFSSYIWWLLPGYYLVINISL